MSTLFDVLFYLVPICLLLWVYRVRLYFWMVRNGVLSPGTVMPGPRVFHMKLAECGGLEMVTGDDERAYDEYVLFNACVKAFNGYNLAFTHSNDGCPIHLGAWAVRRLPPQAYDDDPSVLATCKETLTERHMLEQGFDRKFIMAMSRYAKDAGDKPVPWPPITPDSIPGLPHD